MRFFFTALSLILLSPNINAQSDTAFWFAAPEVSSAFNYDRPIIFRITTYGVAANVSVSQPANPAFPVQNLIIPANSTQAVNLTTWIDLVECRPGDVVQNKGIRILSNNKIAVSYEVGVNGPNPELFALKGQNALGMEFYISSQYLLNNMPSHTPTPYSSFNIVASEDNTLVTINPRAAIVGHAANIPFNILLNRGQTYAAIAASTLASQHLHGSRVTSNKPVAITLSDDLLQGTPYSGLCEDLAGDQTVPVSILGTEYIGIRSNLNSPFDKLYITATVNGTIVSQDGVAGPALNAGQSVEYTITNPTTYIQASSPVYVYQLGGVGCEVGSAILPQINCTGSSEVSITRTSQEDCIITLLVKSGGQNNFLINNTPGIIVGSLFTLVPGTADWYWAKVIPPASIFIPGSVIRIRNTSKVFQMGVMQGGSASGAAFGYFSDFNSFTANANASQSVVCSGDSIKLFADTIISATYNWTGPGGFSSNAPNIAIQNVNATNSGNYYLSMTIPGCGTYTDSINISVQPSSATTLNSSICEGQSFLGYTTSGTYRDTLIAANGCDSIRTLNLIVNPKTFSTLNHSICEGESFLGYTLQGTYQDTLLSATGCDSIRTLNLTVNQKTFETINTSICEGDNYAGYTFAGTYIDTLQGTNGCDSIRTLNLTLKTRSFSNLSGTICQGYSFHGYTTPGIFIDTLIAANGCDSIRTINLLVNPSSATTLNSSICEGQSFLGYTTSGIYHDTLIAANGCDSIRTINLIVNPKTFSTLNHSICEGESFLGYTLQGIYQDTLLSASGCDSIRTLNLTVNQKTFETINTSICEGDNYAGYSMAGTYIDTLTSNNGCDSIRTINLTLKTRSFSNLSATICEGGNFSGYTLSGNYIDTLVAANGCDSIRAISLIVNPTAFTQLNATICRGQSYEGYIDSGNYIDTLISISGCDSIRHISLLVHEMPLANLGPDKEICFGDSVILNPGSFPGSIYTWNNNSTSSQITVKTEGIFSVDITNVCGSSVDDIFIKLSSCEIYIPNTFTPNNDGKNETFKVINSRSLPDFRFTIYNRWGQKVFESTDSQNGWNGYFNGKKADLGAYVWICQYGKNGFIHALKGTVLLLR